METVISHKLHAKISGYVKRLQRYVNRWWYPPAIAVLAALDNLIVIVPTDGILISSSMINPRRWHFFAVAIAVGSTAGAVILSYLVEIHGLPWILHMYPGLDQTHTWIWTDRFFSEYGLLLVFAVAMTPLMQQPTVILASLAGESIVQIGLVVLAGRTLKFILIAYLGSHAPRLLSKMWGIRTELEDAGVQLPE